MSEPVESTIPGTGLSEVERVVNVFAAPSKTFTDILRSTRWWLPFLLMMIVTLGVTATIDKKVGFARVAENELHQNPKQEDQFNSLTAEQKDAQMRGRIAATRYISYCFTAFILIFIAASALLYWGTFNFILGAQTTYKQMFAVWMYASLPKLIIGILTIATLLFGADPDAFDMRNAVGTNLAYYMPDSTPVIRAILGFIDIIGLWQLALLAIGTAIVAKVSRGKAAAVVVGWWVIGLVVSVGIALATS